ncbi:hypothetical protein COL5a_004206 [Colletotrichum fioriniae]|nr:uncharacterized protein COL516b_000300 [Colletotrichum fioriniae]KAJ0313364.1 hypothetical protein COL516b_000300 [Colletotrichum fioriniae]KAJ0329639.1 hypothetical protein COL5a_004206 [Colletotrichum fioriniae]
MSFHVLSLYMHEIALHTQMDDIRPPFDTATLKDGMLTNLTLTTSHINALSACLSAIDGIFEAFLAMEVPSIRCLPVFNFVRVAYAVVVLIKMYFSATAPGSELGRVIDKDNMKVEYYLDALLEKFRAAASDDRSRPAAKFLIVLVMLRSWFLKQSKGLAMGVLPVPDAAAGFKTSNSQPETPASAAQPSSRRPDATPASTAAEEQQQQQQQAQQRVYAGQQHPPMHEYPAANTPLHLLSEIATQNDRSGGGSGGGATNNILWNPPPSRQSFLYDPSAVTPTPMDGPGSGPGTAASSGTAATTVAGPGDGSGAGAGPGPNPVAPWLNPVWTNDLQDFGLDPGFTNDLSLEEITTGFGTSPGSLSNGMRYVMAQDPWLSGMSGLGEIFEGMPGGSGPPMFPM